MVHKQKIMAVGAHADDIEVIAGGTLMKYKDQGYEIVYVMTTNNMSGITQELQSDGLVKRWKESAPSMMKRRKRECEDAAEMLGTEPIHLDHPQRHYTIDDETIEIVCYGSKRPDIVPESMPTILTAYEDKVSVQKVVDLILEHNPACIITLGIATSNIEHFATSLLVTKAFWLAVEQSFRGALIHGREDYTSLGDINTKWDTYIDISDYLDAKMKLLGKHHCQMPTAHESDHGHRLRPMKWGVSCGCKAAEVFTWVRRYDIPDLDTTKEYYSPLITELTHHSK